MIFVENPEPGDRPNPAGGPTQEVRRELEKYLQDDETRLGQVYRLNAAGRTADSIATELGVATSNFVWNMSRLAEAILDGNLPSAPSLALQFSRKFRTMLKLRHWTPAARSYLERTLDELDRDADSPEARAEEEADAEAKTRRAEESGASGIYVYSLPHYLRHPYEPKLGHTLLKVGKSDNDVIRRFREQTRTTALPEEPVLLRIYQADDATSQSVIEATFHRLLRTASHAPTATRSAGREWFSTKLEFLDEIARTLGLNIDVVNDFTAEPL